jgi:hypothetical protein
MSTPPAPDLVLLNGKVTVTAGRKHRPHESEAIAIRSGRVLAVGANDDVSGLAGEATTVVDVEGRRVIPGLIDSHVHFVRAGVTWNDETRWERIHDLEEGLGLIRDAAQTRPFGTWIRVIGGWHPNQLTDRRGPTLEELDRVAPGHPVIVQNQYEWALLNTLGMQAMGLTSEVADAVGPVSLDRDGDGRPLGIVRGIASLRWLYAQLPVPSLEEQVESTVALSREFARFGITGVIDGGGINSGPDMYRAVSEARRRNQLRTRVRLMIHASGPGVEREEYETYLRDVHPLEGDASLQVIGLGEIVLYAIHDSTSRPPSLTREAREDLDWICARFAAARWPLQIHACRRETVDAILDCWEAVDREHPVRALRWGLVHAECLDPSTIERLRRLGAGALIPSLFRFEGDSLLDSCGAERMRTSPPLRAILNAGVPLGGGTDALRVASYLPFTALRWYTDGLSVSGQRTRDDANLLSREEALRAYTAAGAWFSFEEQSRGTLEPGRLADLAVLSGDYFSVPAEEIADLESELTLLGGEPVWSAPPFRGLATQVAGGPGHSSAS